MKGQAVYPDPRIGKGELDLTRLRVDLHNRVRLQVADPERPLSVGERRKRASLEIQPLLDLPADRVYLIKLNRCLAANPKVMSVIGDSSCRREGRCQSPDLGPVRAT